MRVQQIANLFDGWAPKFIQWERDNTGLLVGKSQQEVTGVLLCLDVTSDALERAQKLKCNLVISHHPLIFFPLKKITPETDRTSDLIFKLIKNDTSLLSYHTNLDFTSDGVNHQTAKKLQISDLKFLKPVSDKSLKLVTFVPKTDLGTVSDAVFGAGAGVIGEYSNCSFTSEGTGTFTGSENSEPTIGKKQKFEKVEEVRLEVLINEGNSGKVIKALLDSHPYEEPAYDIYPLKNSETLYGQGVTGYLKDEMEESRFLKHISECLNCEALRHSNFTGKKIKKVAVFGGSASEHLEDAINAGCDAFITADVRYHTFQDAENRILLVDAGHFETEVPVLEEMKRRLNKLFTETDNNTKVYIFDGVTNPVNYYSNLERSQH